MSAEMILQSMLKNTADKYDKSEGMFLYDVEKAVAIEINNLEVKNENFIDKIDVEKLTGEELERFVYQRTGVMRKAATFASSPVVVIASAPATIVAGELVAAEDLFYEVVEDTSLLVGANIVMVRCMQSGTIGNVPVGAINAFPVTLLNIVSVTNTEAFFNGYERESDESLRQRYYDRLRNPGKAGNPEHFKQWAQEVPGVGKVKVVRCWDGPLSVLVAILDGNNAFATPTLLEQTHEHIMSQLSIGPDVTLVTATRLTVNISAAFILAHGYIWKDVAPRIAANLNVYYDTIAFEDDVEYLSYAQIGRYILSVEGVEDYANLLINEGTSNIPIQMLEKAVTGSVTNIDDD